MKNSMEDETKLRDDCVNAVADGKNESMTSVNM